MSPFNLWTRLRARSNALCPQHAQVRETTIFPGGSDPALFNRVRPCGINGAFDLASVKGDPKMAGQ